MRIKYFVLELKKSLEIIKKNCLIFFITILFLAAAFAAVNFLITQKIVSNPMKVAVVVNEDDNMTKMIMRYISHEESIKDISEFEYCNKDNAFSMLYSNEVNAVIDLGYDFFDDVNNGTNTPLSIYIRDNSDLITIAFAGMLYSAQGYVQNTEAAVYSFLKVIDENQCTVKELNMNIGDYLALQYGKLILHRQNLFDNDIVSSYGSSDIYGYFFICILVFLNIYIILNFGAMYDKSDCSFGKVIGIYGVTPLNKSLIKQSVIAIPAIAFTALFLIIKHIVFSIFNIKAEEGVLYFIGLFLTIIGIVSLYNMIMSFLGNKPFSLLFVIFFFSILLISSGILIPYTFLPSFFEYIGKISPLYYTNNIIFAQSPFISIVVSFLFIVFENIMVIKCERP